jgi:hypothetical protein
MSQHEGGTLPFTPAIANHYANAAGSAREPAQPTLRVLSVPGHRIPHGRTVPALDALNAKNTLAERATDGPA